MKRVPIIDSPDLTDLVIGEIQENLVKDLPWLDHAFGRAERLVKNNGFKERIYTPNVYAGGNEYVEVMPDSGFGNFCFFWMDDPQNVEYLDRTLARIETDVRIIFWFDYRKVLNANIRNREQVKRQIMDSLAQMLLRTGRFTLNQVYEQADNIYQDFDLDEIDNQFLMQPYGGFRFDGTLVVKAKCL